MLNRSLLATLAQIGAILDVVSTLPAAQRSTVYVQSHVGVHVRHVIDHVQAFLAGLQTGEIDYNVRHRNSPSEVDPDFAAAQLLAIMSACEALENLNCAPPEELLVTSEIDCLTTHTEKFRSNAAREVLYLINHTIHHAAYVRLLLQGCGIELASHIGIAPCTATFQRESQQSTAELSACAR
ncbi:MAG: hypothetical protein Q7U82_17790 [Gammaproteobacteria bacterium]|nr:hypothetical protein [Gammaproteobacteria bacterium]